MTARIEYIAGPYTVTVETWEELWEAMWRAVAYAIAFRISGKCAECGCEIARCDYCAHGH